MRDFAASVLLRLVLESCWSCSNTAAQFKSRVPLRWSGLQYCCAGQIVVPLHWSRFADFRLISAPMSQCHSVILLKCNHSVSIQARLRLPSFWIQFMSFWVFHLKDTKSDLRTRVDYLAISSLRTWFFSFHFTSRSKDIHRNLKPHTGMCWPLHDVFCSIRF